MMIFKWWYWCDMNILIWYHDIDVWYWYDIVSVGKSGSAQIVEEAVVCPCRLLSLLI